MDASLSFGSLVSAWACSFRLVSFALALSSLALLYTACRCILLRISDTLSPAITHSLSQQRESSVNVYRLRKKSRREILARPHQALS